MDKKEIFERFLTRVLESDKNYQIAVQEVRKNSSGKIWLFGGSVYRPLIRFCYCCGGRAKDYDFLVEQPIFPLKFSEGFSVKKNRFDTYNVSNEEVNFDFIPLQEVKWIKDRKLEPTIENFLKHCAFDLHSLVYDVNEKKLEGLLGIEAISQKTLRVNDLEQAREYAKIYGKTLEELMKEKANQLNFDLDTTFIHSPQ